MIYFSSDLHLSHERIISACHRPFSSADEMDRVIEENFSFLTKQDTLFYLGDLGWNTLFSLNFWNRLRCNKVFIKGNHDKLIWNSSMERTLKVEGYLDTTFEHEGVKYPTTLCHYPMISWNKSHFGAWQIFGHHHNNIISQKFPPGKRINVGVDNWNFKPVSLPTIIEEMKKLPNNWDFLGDRYEQQEAT